MAARNTPQKLVWRARIVLMWADGAGVTTIVRALGKTKRTAYRWRDRYSERGLAGLERDASRPGRRKPLEAAMIARVVEITLHEQPPAATHWTARKLARRVGLSHASVQRIWAAHALKPHLSKTFKVSNDHGSSRRSPTWSGFTWTRPNMPLVLQLTRRAKFKPWTAHRRACRWSRVGRDDDPRLQAKRHDDVVRRTRVAAGQVIGTA